MNDTVCSLHGSYYYKNITQQRPSLRMQNKWQSILSGCDKIVNINKSKIALGIIVFC